MPVKRHKFEIHHSRMRILTRCPSMGGFGTSGAKRRESLHNDERIGPRFSRVIV